MKVRLSQEEISNKVKFVLATIRAEKISKEDLCKSQEIIKELRSEYVNNFAERYSRMDLNFESLMQMRGLTREEFTVLNVIQ